MMYRILRGKVEQFARHYHGPKFHAILCDAPYHLTTITDRFGKDGSAPAKGDVYARSAAGFMGQQWDGGNVAFKPETWAGLAAQLYPGGFGMTFGGARTYHRIAVAIEDAGLIIHPMIFCYAFGSGFPKATRIDTQVDKLHGMERPDKLQGGHIGMSKHAGDSDNENELENTIPHVVGKGNHTNGTPIHPLAQTWRGHRYGLQAMKPAIEPIILFQKPYEGRPVDNITATGAGALNVDGTRIPGSWEWGTQTDIRGGGYDNKRPSDGDVFARNVQSNPAGRWPSNLILQHTPQCTQAGDDWQCVDGCPVKRLGEQSGERAAGSNRTGNEPSPKTNGIYNDFAKNNIWESYADSGTAARFFYQADWSYDIYEQLANADPVYYTAKASATERNAGLEGRNPHPTIKPISLTKYLATLLLPPDAYSPRRILCPFAGTGSEMIGAILAGWDEVIGVEMTAKYIPVAKSRLAWWSQWPGWGQTDVDKILQAQENELPLFSFSEAAQ